VLVRAPRAPAPAPFSICNPSSVRSGAVVDVVLPVLDEAAALPWVLGRMPAGFRPLVVDNGSTDGSAEIALRRGARVVREPCRGFGAACHAGLLAAGTDVVCFMDCDGSLDPLELPRVAVPVLAGARDLMLGARRPEPGAWPLHARVANRALSLELRRRSGLVLTDLGPMRAAPRQALLGLALRDRRFGYPLEMVLRAVAAGWRVDETAVRYRARAGRSKVTGTVRGTARAVADMAWALR
jgi:glycosyltransferase involved in cell wall biosynthesis